MSKDKKSKDDEDGGKKKGGGLVVKLVIGLVLIAAGGGGVFGLMAAGIIGEHHEEEVDNSPQLVRKDEVDPYAPAEGDAIEIVHGEGGSEFRTAYYTFEDDFTSNLKHSDALVQMTLATSTQRDGRILMWLQKHDLAIRSDLLVTLADTPEEDLIAPGGKERLQERLTASINHILTETEGFGGVDEVYFRSFIVQ